jgi:hypothetical protein
MMYSSALDMVSEAAGKRKVSEAKEGDGGDEGDGRS